MFDKWYKASQDTATRNLLGMSEPEFTLEIMGRTVESERAYYLDLWSRLVVKADWTDRIDRIIDRMIQNRPRYERAGESSGKTPWWVVAIIHVMEGSGDFSTHLHNGDPLNARTVQVPEGRPFGGQPPFTWEESAVDAITLDGVAENEDWTVESLAYVFERFNGFGYRSRGIVSPYLAAQTNLWTRGKYVADGRFDPNAGSSQVGALAFVKRLYNRGVIEIQGIGTLQPPTSPTPSKVTWFELFRGPTGKPVAVAHAGSVPVEVMTDSDVAGLMSWFNKYPGAKTFIVAPSGKPIPQIAKVVEDRRAKVTAFARNEAAKGRSHAAGNEIDVKVLDPIRPALVRLGHLGASQKDTFWDWCGAWVTYVLRGCGLNVPDVPTVDGRPYWASVALVESWVAWAKDRGAWRAGVGGNILPGDIVIFDWDADRLSDHIGIVLEPPTAGKNMVTAEGNRGNREIITPRARDVVLGTIDLSKLV